MKTFSRPSTPGFNPTGAELAAMEALRRGRLARTNGQPFDSNPFPTPDPYGLGRAWGRGWKEANRELRRTRKAR